MKRSTDRILTTHTGSLPRPPALIELIRSKQSGGSFSEAIFEETLRDAVRDVVKKQMECGIDVVSDGEEGKPYYATYVQERLTGFGGAHRPSPASAEVRDFPEFSARRIASQSSLIRRPACNGPISWRDFGPVRRDVANFRAAVDAETPVDAFMPAASPGVIAYFLGNEYYKTEDEYLEALAEVMRAEYEAIADAGFVLQVDCPDLAMSRHSQFQHLNLGDFRSVVRRHVEVLNEATKNIDPEQMRLHLCWGNYEGPHLLDVPLKDIIDIALTARPAAVSFEGANPRHAHEWNVWQEVALPDGKVIIPGVIDSVTNFIEHPELIAQRIAQYANLVGRENVIAGSDCGFGTDAERKTVDPKICWAKLEALAEGAALATKALWP